MEPFCSERTFASKKSAKEYIAEMAYRALETHLEEGNKYSLQAKSTQESKISLDSPSGAGDLPTISDERETSPANDSAESQLKLVGITADPPLPSPSFPPALSSPSSSSTTFAYAALLNDAMQKNFNTNPVFKLSEDSQLGAYRYEVTLPYRPMEPFCSEKTFISKKSAKEYIAEMAYRALETHLVEQQNRMDTSISSSRVEDDDVSSVLSGSTQSQSLLDPISRLNTLVMKEDGTPLVYTTKESMGMPRTYEASLTITTGLRSSQNMVFHSEGTFYKKKLAKASAAERALEALGALRDKEDDSKVIQVSVLESTLHIIPSLIYSILYAFM